jgi:hypothetical protein
MLPGCGETTTLGSNFTASSKANKARPHSKPGHVQRCAWSQWLAQSPQGPWPFTHPKILLKQSVLRSLAHRRRIMRGAPWRLAIGLTGCICIGRKRSETKKAPRNVQQYQAKTQFRGSTYVY